MSNSHTVGRNGKWSRLRFSERTTHILDGSSPAVKDPVADVLSAVLRNGRDSEWSHPHTLIFLSTAH